jgi:F-type H+-transporting ATPase subunit b
MAEPHAASNFLLPNATFIVELIAFVVFLTILGRYALPVINKALTDRQAAIRKEFEEAEQAKKEANKAEQEYKSQLVEARHEAARIREEAREQGAAIIAEMRNQANDENERILKHGRTQLQAERTQAVQSLRNEVGTMATTLAGRIVGESLEDDKRRSRTVERFVATLESDGSSSAKGKS